MCPKGSFFSVNNTKMINLSSVITRSICQGLKKPVGFNSILKQVKNHWQDISEVAITNDQHSSVEVAVAVLLKGSVVTADLNRPLSEDTVSEIQVYETNAQGVLLILYHICFYVLKRAIFSSILNSQNDAFIRLRTVRKPKHVKHAHVCRKTKFLCKQLTEATVILDFYDFFVLFFLPLSYLHPQFFFQKSFGVFFFSHKSYRFFISCSSFSPQIPKIHGSGSDAFKVWICFWIRDPVWIVILLLKSEMIWGLHPDFLGPPTTG